MLVNSLAYLMILILSTGDDSEGHCSASLPALSQYSFSGVTGGYSRGTFVLLEYFLGHEL